MRVHTCACQNTKLKKEKKAKPNPTTLELSAVALAYNLSIWKIGAGGLQ